MDKQTLISLIHGEPDVGKSWLGATAPAPRLVLDVEGGSRHVRKLVDGKAVRIPTITWNPKREQPPEIGEWETCQVFVRDFDTINRAYEYLVSGNHPFRSVIMDSLTEIQKRCKDVIAGIDTPSERMWGQLLIQMEQLVRQFRDLTFHEINPIECIVILALTQERGKLGKNKPAVQGALGVSLPSYVDLEGYLATYTDDEGKTERRLLIHNHESFEAKCRLHALSEAYGSVIVNPNFEEMLNILNTEEND